MDCIMWKWFLPVSCKWKNLVAKFFLISGQFAYIRCRWECILFGNNVLKLFVACLINRLFVNNGIGKIYFELMK